MQRLAFPVMVYICVSSAVGTPFRLFLLLMTSLRRLKLRKSRGGERLDFGLSIGGSDGILMLVFPLTSGRETYWKVIDFNACIVCYNPACTVKILYGFYSTLSNQK